MMKKYAILGAARSGESLAKFLIKHNQEVTLFDDKKSKYLPLQAFNENDFDVVVKSPGIPNDHPVLLNHKKFLYSDIEIVSQYMPGTNFLAITGTNGKTTTSTLLAHLLCAKLGGNVGIGLADVVSDGDVVVEVSSFQCEGLENFKPHLAALLNLTPDHLDRYLSVEEYYLSKFNLFKNMNENDYLIVNGDDINIKRLIKTNDLKCQIISVSLKNNDCQVYLKAGSVYYLDTCLFNLCDLNLIGEHNLFNAMVASTIAYLNGLLPQNIQKKLKQFNGIEHRMEKFFEHNGVIFINDSKATNPEASEVAIKSFEKNVHWILGGYDKHTSFEILKKYGDRAKYIYVFGQTKNQLHSVFPKSCIYDNLDQVLNAVANNVSNGDVVLFSPACASFDQFIDYNHRGIYFKEKVKEIFK